MTTPQWAPGTLYQPGALVVPRTSTFSQPVPPNDPDFESGTLDHWTATPVGGSAAGAISTAYKFNGSRSFLWAGGSGIQSDGGIGCDLVNDLKVPVVPGQSITANCYCMSVPMHRERGVFGNVRIYWYDADEQLISISGAQPYGGGTPGKGFGTTGQWILSTVTAVAPQNAAYAAIGAYLQSNQGDANGSYVDGFSWNYVPQQLPPGLVFRAVQTDAGFSGASEPIWPVTAGQQVTDNEVTWEALFASRVIWEASPIMVSGSTEPQWPTAPGGTVVDGSVVWVALDWRIKDPRCPHSKIVAAAAKKIFAADKDIIAYCETVNPLNWSSEGDAGYLPFGLQSHGASPVQGLGLYRGNLVAFNEQGYQMWQVDEDPANMALLDAVPVGCRFHHSIQPVSNDLVFLTDQGIRNIGIAGASTNIQAGFFGAQIDELVLEAMATGMTPHALFWPGAGQYWLFFGSEAFVLTMNGGPKDMHWSRYEFPADIDDWTLHEGKLLLRAGTLVWEVTPDALVDDEGGDDIPFEGYMAWHYLDFGRLGAEKMLEGFDLVCTGEVSVSVGYNQKQTELTTDGYLIDGDTLPNVGLIPLPLAGASFQFRLTFSYGQAWEWSSLNVHLQQGDTE